MADIKEIEAAKRAKWEAETVGIRDDGRTYTIAALRAAFDKYHKAAGWKDPVAVVIDCREGDAVTFCRAVEFFQGDRPHVENAGEPTAIRVTSRGYQG